MAQPFTIDRVFPVTPERVWNAITDPAEMKNWYFDLPGFKAKVGYRFEFMAGQPGGIQYRHLCEVTEVIPGSKLTYSWKYDGYEGDSFVSFILTKVEEGTHLRLVHAGIETFPASNPDLVPKNFEAGWTEIIGNSLAAYLAKG